MDRESIWRDRSLGIFKWVLLMLCDELERVPMPEEPFEEDKKPTQQDIDRMHAKADKAFHIAIDGRDPGDKLEDCEYVEMNSFVLPKMRR